MYFSFFFKKIFFYNYVEIDNIDDFKFSGGDLVGEKTGKINKDYTLLNPPLGKGKKLKNIFIIKLNTYHNFKYKKKYHFFNLINHFYARNKSTFDINNK